MCSLDKVGDKIGRLGDKVGRLGDKVGRLVVDVYFLPNARIYLV